MHGDRPAEYSGTPRKKQIPSSDPATPFHPSQTPPTAPPSAPPKNQISKRVRNQRFNRTTVRGRVSVYIPVNTASAEVGACPRTGPNLASNYSFSWAPIRRSVFRPKRRAVQDDYRPDASTRSSSAPRPFLGKADTAKLGFP